MESVLTSTQIELHVPDFTQVKEYYGRLGFEVIWERTPEEMKGYLIMKMDQNLLCFWAGNEYVYQQPYFKKFPNETPRGYGVEVVIVVADVKKYYQQVKDFANVVEELVLQPWGLKDFRTVDPFGYYLRFTVRHNSLDQAFAIK